MKARLSILVGVLVLVGGTAAWAKSDDAVTFAVSGGAEPPQAHESPVTCSWNPSGPSQSADAQAASYSGTETCNATDTLDSTPYDGSGGDLTATLANGTVLHGGVDEGAGGAGCTASASGGQTEVIAWSNGVKNTTPDVSGSVTYTSDCGGTLKFSDDQHSTLQIQAHLVDTRPFCPVGVSQCGASSSVSGGFSNGTGAFATNNTGSFGYSFHQYRSLRALSAFLANTIRWTAQLHHGGPSTVIVYPYPGSHLTAHVDPGLAINSVPKAVCTATATSSGGKSVKLGTKSTPSSGSMRLVPKLTRLLSPGKWTISIACGKAPTKATYTVTG